VDVFLGVNLLSREGNCQTGDRMSKRDQKTVEAVGKSQTKVHGKVNLENKEESRCEEDIKEKRDKI